MISLSPAILLTGSNLRSKIIELSDRANDRWDVDGSELDMARGRILLTFGPYELDPEALELRREGRLVRLAPQACRLLVALTAAPNEVLSRDRLQRALWADATHVDFERSLNSAMRKLRVALNEAAESPRYVQTLHGRGYRFIAPVQRPAAGATLDPADPSSAAAPSPTTSAAAPAPTSNAAVWPALRAALAGCIAGVCAATLVLWPDAATDRVQLLVRLDGASPATQSDLSDALRLVAELQAQIAEARLISATTSDRALAAYRQGQLFGGVRLPEIARAIESFEEAVRADADFAPAWAALARSRATLAMLDGRAAPELRKARSEALRALTSDPELADAHIALGQVRLALDNDPSGAEADLRRARALGTDAGRHRLWLAWALNAEGRNAEGLRIVDEALSLEPNNALFHAWRGLLLHALRRYDDEIVALQRATSMDEASWLAALQLGLGYSRRGEYDRAIPALKRAVALSDAGGVSLSWLGRIAADAGDSATAAEALRQLRDAARVRGLAPSLAASVEHHMAGRRQGL
jgi:DNA-binding winged helix-turn-helix (wHTH) protein/Tfp pilus assembly protein PilF